LFPGAWGSSTVGVSLFLVFIVTVRTPVLSSVFFGAVNLFITEQELRAKVAERTINSIRVFIRVLFRPGGLFPFDFVDAFDIGYVPHDRLQLVETVNSKRYVNCRN